MQKSSANMDMVEGAGHSSDQVVWVGTQVGNVLGRMITEATSCQSGPSYRPPSLQRSVSNPYSPASSRTVSSSSATSGYSTSDGNGSMSNPVSKKRTARQSYPANDLPRSIHVRPIHGPRWSSPAIEMPGPTLDARNHLAHLITQVRDSLDLKVARSVHENDSQDAQLDSQPSSREPSPRKLRPKKRKKVEGVNTRTKDAAETVAKTLRAESSKRSPVVAKDAVTDTEDDPPSPQSLQAEVAQHQEESFTESETLPLIPPIVPIRRPPSPPRMLPDKPRVPPQAVATRGIIPSAASDHHGAQANHSPHNGLSDTSSEQPANAHIHPIDPPPLTTQPALSQRPRALGMRRIPQFESNKAFAPPGPRRSFRVPLPNKSHLLLPPSQTPNVRQATYRRSTDAADQTGFDGIAQELSPSPAEVNRDRDKPSDLCPEPVAPEDDPKSDTSFGSLDFDLDELNAICSQYDKH
ncbi:hypothetical protein SISSUDRAFT_1131244 [Sistotremastrum suecicum HHB10207 ss-3]|uniref:Uncharacterized protein n=1 Tax=Sistotremastrum suecicum HHB10207 ss-3 TaxID=1314776 RepID=A0A166AEZ7_9AGAM|nr:hypothetical protein SISSUDRAFT_1131244 [Sistotremastrum suecicum HHB10207 ss-3]